MNATVPTLVFAAMTAATPLLAANVSTALASTSAAAVPVSSAGDALEVTPLAVAHHGELDGDRVRWRSLVQTDSYRRDTPLPPLASLPLAVPLPLGSEVRVNDHPCPGVVKDAEGRIAVIAFPHGEWSHRNRNGRFPFEVTIDVNQPLARASGRVALVPPLIRGDAVQRVVFAPKGDLQFEPSPDLRVMLHATHRATEEVSHRMRRQFERLVADGLDVDPTAVYLTANPKVISEGGIPGTLTSRSEQRKVVSAVAGAVGLLLIGGLAFGYRVLTRFAERDGRQRRMNAEIERLDDELEKIDGTLARLETDPPAGAGAGAGPKTPSPRAGEEVSIA